VGDYMNIDDELQNILNIMFTLAIVIALAKIIQIGIMFMLNPTGKSKAKEAVFPWLVGVFVCASFMAVGNMVIDLFNSNSGGPFDIFILPQLMLK